MIGYSEVAGECLQCDYACLTCSSETVCETCKKNRYLKDKSCPCKEDYTEDGG